MLYDSRTDLASESCRIWERGSGQLSALPGVIAQRESLQGLELMSVRISSPQGEKALGKPQGQYYTLSLPRQFYPGSEGFPAAVNVLAELIGRCAGKPEKVLVAALGNPDITPDALGHLAAESILVTRHLKETGTESGEDFSAFCSLALSRPGVLGTSGMESAMQISCLAEQIKPELVLVIDALAGADMDGLCSCVQLSDSGIAPGSGIGNDRHELSRGSLGVPVVAIGMPTVVDAAALGAEEQRGLFVTPRDIDSRVRHAGKLIGYAVNLALHKGLSLADMEMLLG